MLSLRYTTQIKKAGERIDVQKPLLPGHVIVVSDRLDLVIRTLRETTEFSRLLMMGEPFVPLAAEERASIEALSNNHNRCIGMSMGVIEYGRVAVQSGPVWARSDDSECELT